MLGTAKLLRDENMHPVELREASPRRAGRRPRDPRARAGRRSRGLPQRDQRRDGAKQRARTRRGLSRGSPSSTTRRAVAELLAAEARRGGRSSSPAAPAGRAYEHAAALEPDWRGASVWWGDERCVPPDDERSNYGLAQRTLSTASSGPRGPPDPRRAAAGRRGCANTTRSSRASRSTCPARPRPGRPCRLALPGIAQLLERDRLRDGGPPARAVRRPRDDDAPALLSARHRLPRPGADKADASPASAGDRRARRQPAPPGDSPIDVYLDAAAAAQLARSSGRAQRAARPRRREAGRSITGLRATRRRCSRSPSGSGSRVLVPWKVARTRHLAHAVGREGIVEPGVTSHDLRNTHVRVATSKKSAWTRVLPASGRRRRRRLDPHDCSRLDLRP